MNRSKITDIYKKTDGCSIKADIYFNPNKEAPVVVFIHGGALIWGSREDMNPQHIVMYMEAGFSIVSIEYRLAPETALHSIIEDVQDALGWISTEGKSKYGLNTEQLAVIGSSAGGYLSLMTGTFSNKPKVIVSFYGYGDLLGDWYCMPSEFYCQQRMVQRDEAYDSVGSKPISEGKGDRFKYYLYCRQNGIWTSEVSGHDIIAERKEIEAFCPLYRAQKDFPPTLLLHGDRDTDVPYMQSLNMAQKLTELGVENQLIPLEGRGHAFDYAMDDAVVQDAFAEVVSFLRKHLL